MSTAPGPEFEADYEALRRGLGAYRRPRDVLAVTGPDALTYLQGQVSQDLDGLEPGAAADALLLEPDGKLCALIRVVRADEDTWWLDTDEGFGQVVAARLGRFKLRTKVEIEPVEADCVALRGAAVPTVASDAADGVVSLAFSWNGAVGVDLLGPGAEAVVPADARWCGAAAAEALRVEAGLPVMGRELDGRTIAAEAGLVERTVSFTKGCYTGQELIARLDARGNRVARRLCAFVVPEPAADGDSVVRRLAGAEALSPEGKGAGTVTSAAWCPGVAGPAGLGYLHRSVAVPGPVTVVLGPTDDGRPAVRLAAEARPVPLVP